MAASARADERGLSFNRDIRPILSENCFRCHGPDASHREAGLRLDDGAAAAESGAIVPGEPDRSELVARIFSEDPDTVMPPPAANKRLSLAEKERLGRWIAEGGHYEGHWSYLPPLRPNVPAGENGIDHLVGQQLASRGLDFSPEADRRTLIRRLYFDLVGLPPTAEAVERFVRDEDRDAYGKLVTELLASPHYGERMALGWLDVVRFADTIGYHSDNPRNVWPYRDYVIAAFNENKPFDRFTIEQLAGDLLPNPPRESLVGSCFNRLLLTTEEGGAQPQDYRARMLTDRVRAVGTVWLGQTLGCCQCHDHKFDPATSRDFYALGAFFADVREPDIGRREDGLLLASEEQSAELARRDAEIAEIRESLADAGLSPDAKKPPAEGPGVALHAQLAAARQARADFEAAIARCLVTVSTASNPVRILPRGNWMDETGEVVEPAVPAYLPQPPVEGGRRATRLDLAHWIVSPENPLTARVFVNRLWKQFFGLGISRTLDDLGSQGEWPVHPELLDWMAGEFVAAGWDVKHLVRTIVNSRTYRQASTAPAELLLEDPENRWLARQTRFRLDAELVRDNALCMAGLLDSSIGGPSGKPYQPDGYWENLNFPPRTYAADPAPAQYRRGLYTWWQRSFLHPSLLAFDAPSREECCAERSRSNIPQQALVLLNDPTYVEAARAFASRILREGGPDTAARLDWAWRQALGRAAEGDELAVVQRVLDQHQAEFAAEPAAAAELLQVGLEGNPPDLPAAELAAWTSVARILFNLHETITRS